MHPVLVQIPGLPVPLYSFGTCLSLSLLACYVAVEKEVERLQLKIDGGYVMIGAIVCGVAGAKLHYMLSYTGEAMDGAGFNFQGGAVCGTVYMIIYIRLCKERLMLTLDSFAPILALGLGLGKIACFVSGDGCYGPPSNLPWAMTFPNGGMPTKVAVHPTPLYETAGGLVVFAMLWRRRGISCTGRGHQVASMLVGLGVERFLAEFVRTHDTVMFGLTQYQLTAMVMITAGICWHLLLIFFAQHKKASLKGVAVCTVC